MSIKIAVVGGGFMGRLHARTVAESAEAELAAVVDRDPAAGRAAADELGTRHLPEVEDALNEDVDAFIVAVPDRAHVGPATTALRAGRPVLVEKPMADTLEGARAIDKAAAEGGTHVAVGQILRFDPRYAGAAAAVAAGDIGEPLPATAGRIAARDIGLRMDGSSSVLFYLGVHDVDAMQWVTGKRITRVYSRAVSKLMPSNGVRSEDAIFTVAELEDGTIGELFNGWTRRSDDPVSIDGRLEVVGTEGTVAVDVRDHGLRVYGDSGLATPDALHWPEVNARIRGDLAAEVRAFVAGVRDGAEFPVPTAAAMRNVAVNDAILRSVESGVPEDVEVVDRAESAAAGAGAVR
ncbi:Gfo/Idh/MocA family oxidoreductase [Actinomadura sp. 7K507]|uniref:Gfo/Idh/MocA family protein n=1 Tax=Actinomadura sp. 7K507 TaxID=2530365 RepID=UPI001042EE64|nr:Gfo/Idh/MocA family oxidoreductase [Actinomadura sp. 7K507]TDC97629.1 Gfo/Idh/MocA family oxidoreductase [Actinomadura sp. 7K507]